MRINGEWHPCDDGFSRPVILVEIRTSNGDWVEFPFLVDSGSDITTVAPEVLPELRMTLEPADYEVAGIGGRRRTSTLQTSIRFECDDGSPANFDGTFAALTEEGSLDMCLLDRDILDDFAVILDREHDVVVLINDPHRYSISFE